LHTCDKTTQKIAVNSLWWKFWKC